LAWDCATGNGQAARVLSGYFQQVIATDASSQKISNTLPAVGIEFQVSRADPLELIKATLESAWSEQGIPGKERIINWPLKVIAGRYSTDYQYA